MGGVALYETQPLALVNEGTATAKDVQAMAEEVARLVFEKMKIKIETEVRII
jgi:UDP-N-acetylenolpyruvoylglucosamine reductase